MSIEDEIKRTLALIQAHSPVFEIRIPKANKYGGTYAGYYDSVNLAVQDILKWNGKVPSIYLTLNNIQSALLARAINRMDENAKLTTTDADVLSREWLYVDIDPVRPAGISSTEEEHNAAIEKACYIRDEMLDEGWPEPVVCDSGNGASLLYKIKMENSKQALENVKSVLNAMDYFFSDEKIQVDQSVFNAARIVKVYGTKAKKGDSTVDRPHRDSSILELPDVLQELTPELIQAFLVKVPKEPEPSKEFVKNGSGFDIGKWLSTNDISVKHTKSWNGGTIYGLCECPFDSNHKAPDSSIIQHKSGAISFHCFHNSCQDHTWQEVRAIKEPARKQVKTPKERKGKELKVPIPEIASALKFTNNYDLVEQVQEIQPIYFDNSRNYYLWKKDELFWKLIDKTDILNSIVKVTGNGSYAIENGTKGEIIEAIGMTGRNREVKEVPESWIYCKNGVYDSKTKVICKPTQDYFFTQPVPHDIGDSEDTPTIDRLFKEWMGDRAQILYEICAYCLYNGYPIHRMFWLFGGKGRNGKDQFLELLQRLVGMENTVATDLEILLTSRFESSGLYKKKIAVISETNFNVIKNSGMLKALTGHSYLRGEFKGKDKFNFYNTAKIVIATNGLPETNDKSKAFFARCITLEFKNRFAGKEFNKSIIDTIPEQEYENLIRKCFNKILPELLENGEFYQEGTEEEKEANYERISNPFLIFRERELIGEVDAQTPVWVLRDLYNIFANKNNYRQISDKEFTQTIVKEHIDTKRITIGNTKWNFALDVKPRAAVVYDTKEGGIVVDEMKEAPSPSSPDNQERGRDGRDGLHSSTRFSRVENLSETTPSMSSMSSSPSQLDIMRATCNMLMKDCGTHVDDLSEASKDFYADNIKVRFSRPKEAAREYVNRAIAEITAGHY